MPGRISRSHLHLTEPERGPGSSRGKQAGAQQGTAGTAVFPRQHPAMPRPSGTGFAFASGTAARRPGTRGTPPGSPGHVNVVADERAIQPLIADNGRMASDCPDCGGLFTDSPHPNYDHVHGTAAARLPRPGATPGCVVTRGWATGMPGRLRQMRVFFGHPEPACAFGRAGRMASAGDITSFGVYEAACKVRWDEARRQDIRTLYIARDTGRAEEHDDGRMMLARWVKGCNPQRPDFRPARSRQR